MSQTNSRQLRQVAPSGGRQKLIEAALRLAARDGITLSSMGLRELAREAGLNHNTFYRHFDRSEDLGQDVAAAIAAQLMEGMKDVRLRAARHADATQGVVEYFLDFVKANPDVFVVGLRELHSAASPMRTALLSVLEAIAQESVDQITTLNLAPKVEVKQLFRVTLDITHYMLYRSLDFLDRPRERKALTAQMVAHIRRQFLGAMAMQPA